jgi:hypothetical protein
MKRIDVTLSFVLATRILGINAGKFEEYDRIIEIIIIIIIIIKKTSLFLKTMLH